MLHPLLFIRPTSTGELAGRGNLGRKAIWCTPVLCDMTSSNYTACYKYLHIMVDQETNFFWIPRTMRHTVEFGSSSNFDFGDSPRGPRQGFVLSAEG